MAFSPHKLEETFPITRSPRDKGNVITMRIYQNDRGTVRSVNDIPLTESPDHPANRREFHDVLDQVLDRLDAASRAG